MNLRVANLLAAAALFVRAWSGDAEFQHEQVELRRTAQKSNLYHPSHPRTHKSGTSLRKPPAAAGSARQVSQTGTRRGPESSLPLVLLVELMSRDGSAVDPNEIPMNSLWMFGNCDLPLPPGISVGTYRAVSSRGEVRKIELGAEELEYHGITTVSTPRDLYWVSEGKTQWYFVRVESKPGRMWMAADQPDRLKLLRARVATVSGDLLQDALEKFNAAISGLMVTAGAPTKTSGIRPRGWTWQPMVELRQQWNALLRQVRWETAGAPKSIVIPQGKASSRSRLSAESIERGLR